MTPTCQADGNHLLVTGDQDNGWGESFELPTPGLASAIAESVAKMIEQAAMGAVCLRTVAASAKTV